MAIPVQAVVLDLLDDGVFNVKALPNTSASDLVSPKVSIYLSNLRFH